MKNRDVHVVSPSDWLLDLARKSPVWPLNTQFQKIHYGLDLNKFKPLDKVATRRSLGLPTDKKLIAFGAADVANVRKGFRFLAEALDQIRQKCPQKVECLIFGSGELDSSFQLPRVHSMGFVKDTDQLNQIYSAADVVVVPSLEDNQPQTALEAMACGTPVVGFDAGGIPEIVRHEQTGLLAQHANANNLAEQLIRLVNDSRLQKQLGLNALSLIRSEFEMKTQTIKYETLYREILDDRDRRSSRSRSECRDAA